MAYDFDLKMWLKIDGELEECRVHGKAEITRDTECTIDVVYGDIDGMLLRQADLAPHVDAIAARVLEDYHEPKDDNDQKLDILREEGKL